MSVVFISESLLQSRVFIVYRRTNFHKNYSRIGWLSDLHFCFAFLVVSRIKLIINISILNLSFVAWSLMLEVRR